MPTIKDHPLSQYYQFQSRIYDLTRWSFLFGRKHLLASLPFRPTEPLQILEVGCGTGHNLLRLAKKYPEAEITGIDLSTDMLAKA
ncbi:MAG: methyltransferase domain-containing protein, partial [Bacteroidota bacterium]